jgi:hypothetical protein
MIICGDGETMNVSHDDYVDDVDVDVMIGMIDGQGDDDC